MNRATIGALLLVLLGAIGIGAWYYLAPMLFEEQRRRTSDAPAQTQEIRIGGDNYLGYWFITSPELRKQAARRGLNVQLTDDGGAYADRLAKFAARDYDAIVLPVNSYLQHGAAHRYPGVIVASVAESRGADGIVAFGDRLPSGKVNDLNDPGLRVVYTAESPSAFLLDLTIADFDLDQLRGRRDWRVEVGGSREVYQRAAQNQGDVFVLWEPDLSRALKLPGMRPVWGSANFSGYIVDVFVFRRDFLESKRGAVLDFLDLYFRVLALYANNRERLIQEMAQSTALKEAEIEDMLAKIDWFDLDENCRLQFGIAGSLGGAGTEGVINTIIACTDVLRRTAQIERDPLGGNPYLITNSTVLEELAKRRVASPFQSKSGAPQFPPLGADGWARLPEVGTFRVEPITFQAWNNLLTAEGKETVDRIAQLLLHNYPDYRVVVRGHTAPGGEEAENEKLSLERAEAVVQYLKAVHAIEPNRLHAEGVGSKSPAPRKPQESERAYQYRLARVEFVAVGGSAL
jgi:outer membrane protein OmpA-like peptidoglycan-associated protein/ABC-type nitrate/sulfonate/bicarbonate transport system substrate-binding protein